MSLPCTLDWLSRHPSPRPKLVTDEAAVIAAELAAHGWPATDPDALEAYWSLSGLAADVRTFTTRWQPWPVSLLVRAHALVLLAGLSM